MKVKRRHVMRKKEARKVIESLASMGIRVSADLLEVVETDMGDAILMEGRLMALRIDDHLIPSVLLLLEASPERGWVTVDMGAVPHLANGANVMSPGVVDADAGITEGDIVWIRDERNHRPICVGIALQNGSELVRGRGVGVRVLHHVGDRFWRIFVG